MHLTENPIHNTQADWNASSKFERLSQKIRQRREKHGEQNEDGDRHKDSCKIKNII